MKTAIILFVIFCFCFVILIFLIIRAKEIKEINDEILDKVEHDRKEAKKV